MTWSFMTENLLIPDIAMGIGIATAPDISVERYSSALPSDTSPIYQSDIYGYDSPLYLGAANEIP